MKKKLMYALNSLLICGMTWYLFAINKMNYFINSNYYWWLLLSVSITTIFTVFYIWFYLHSHHKGKPARYSQYIFGALLFAITISLFIVPIKPLGSESASYAKRGQIKNDTKKVQYVSKSPEAITSLTLMDWVNLFSQSTNPLQYNGQKVVFTGFVSSTAADGFDISMYQVSCCVVDAQIYTLPVKTDKQIPSKDDWLKVEGTLAIEGQKPNVVYKLNLSNLEKIDIPSDPYKNN